MTDTSATEQILKQVEFYFSESNLIKDKFLFTTQNANDGWVPIQTISQFERMKKYRPVETIVDALRQSKELLEVSENGEMVRRKIPLPKNYNEIQINMNKRSVYVNKLPVDATLDDLLKYFGSIAPTNQVRMKKSKEGAFTGSCLVEFKDPAAVEEILGKDEVKYNDEVVEVVSKAKYEESKAQKFGARRGNKGKRGRKSEKEEEKEKTDAENAEAKKRDASPVRDAAATEEKKERD